jgi:hypothetical protein
MATLKRTVRSKSRSTKTLPYAASQKRRNKAKKAVPKPYKPERMTARDWVHEGISGLEATRRAFDNLQIYQFRGNAAFAQLENVCFHEELERVMRALIHLDIHMPEVTL